MVTSTRAVRSLSALVGALSLAAAAGAAPKTVCTVTINSDDEKLVMQRHLPKADYRFVELVKKGRPDWFTQACREQVQCDVLVISGHFDDGTEFYTDRFDDREFLTVHEMQHAACSPSCNNLFAQLKEVYLFGCNTLKSTPRYSAGPEVLRSLARSGSSSADAERTAALLSERYGQSNRDRLRHIFKDVPVLYGFASKAPLGRVAGPLMERYFQTAPAGEVGSGRPSATLLSLFGPTSMVALPGLAAGDPHLPFRQDMCSLAGDTLADADKIAFLHQVLQRDMTEVRMFLEHLERYAGGLGPAQRGQPVVAAALKGIERDLVTRERYLAFARDADEATVQVRLMALARQLGWLTPQQEEDEFLHMVSHRMAQGGLGPTEVDLVCTRHRETEPTLARRVLASGAARPQKAAHNAALACLGSAEAHERTLRALTSDNDDDVAIAQVYLRHRPLAELAEVRAVAAGIARMPAAAAQVRAIQTLARQRLADAESLAEIARLFPQARSLAVQRAIAELLIRADTRSLQRAELARSLRQHRLRSPDGQDVIDMLIRLLQQA